MDKYELRDKLVNGFKKKREEYNEELKDTIGTMNISDNQRKILTIKYRSRISGVLEAQLELCESGCGEDEIEDFYEFNKGGLFEKLKNEAEKKIGLENLKGNSSIIYEYIEEHCVQREPAERYGYEGENVTITLPAVGNFKGDKFRFFESHDKVSKEDFEKNPELEEKSHSMKGVSKLLEMINKFLIELQAEENDGDYDYYNELQTWNWGEDDFSDNFASDILKLYVGLQGIYWLKDKRKNERVYWCQDGYEDCYFDCCSENEKTANLFLKLSDSE